MPIFSLGIKKQEQAAAAGVHLYPEIASFTKGVTVGDAFHRESLNVTNALPIYESSLENDGSVVVEDNLRINSGTALNDISAIRTKEYRMSRNPGIPDDDQPDTVNIIIKFSTLSAASTSEGYVGLRFGQTAVLSDIPSTYQIGAEWDTGVDGNFRITSANNSSQDSQDTGIAVANSTEYKLEIKFGPTDTSGTITLRDETNGTSSSMNISKDPTGAGPSFTIDFYIQTKVASSRALFIDSWEASLS